jgi:hypothetical protein
VTSAKIAPEYLHNASAGTSTRYTFSFADTWGDGGRIHGTPNGKYTSLAELAVYFSR